MYDSAKSESPFVQIDLAGFNSDQGGQAGVQIEEQPNLGHINLRGSSGDTAFLEATERLLGVALPVEPNTTTSTEELTLFWMGPDEWLILTQPGGQDELMDKLKEGLADIFAAVTDISSGQTLLKISGDNARRLISKGCPLDIHPAVLKVGDCAQTHLAKSGVLIYLKNSAPEFELVVRRSFSDYLGLWLLDAVAEFS